MPRKQRKPTKGSNKLSRNIIVITMIISISLVVYYLFFLPQTDSWTVAIIDQVTVENLSNQTFTNAVTLMLNNKDFEVKYYPGKGIDLDFYKTLPSKGSKIIILRAHSAVRDDNASVDLFTSEPYEELSAETYYANYGKQISVAEFLGTNNRYFAVGPMFVDSSMRGNFDNDCVIILMGCNGLNKTSMAEALVNKGAKVVIGWTRLVELDDADDSTVKLLQYLVRDKNNIATAVQKINPPNQDHAFRATLDYYPKTSEVKNYIIQLKSNEQALNLIERLFQFLILIISPNWKLKA